MIAQALVAIALVAVGAPALPAAAGPEKPAEAKARKIKMAVLDCRAVGAADPKTIEGLSSLIVTTAAARPELQVIGSSDMRALIGFDRERALLGCTESSCLAEIGGALGVDYLVSSEGSKVGSSWLLTLTLLDTAKSVAVKRLTKRTTSDDQLIDVAVQGVHELLSAVPGLAPSAAPVVTAEAVPPAQEDEEPEADAAPGYRTHDGFYLRFDLGGGALSSSGTGVKMAGPSGSFSFALGYSLTRHLVLYGAAFSTSDTSPTVTTDGQKQDTTGLGVTHSLTALGVGAAYYFTRSNIFVAGTLGGGSVSLEFDEKIFETDKGLVMRADVGKEWWVSTNWGLGIALHLTQGFTPDGDDTKSMIKSTAYGVSFSATYN